MTKLLVDDELWQQIQPPVEAIPPVRGRRGRPRRRPDQVQGDRAYHSEPHREELGLLRIEPVLAQRFTEHGSGLGIYRWVVERTLAWLINSAGCASGMSGEPTFMKLSSSSGVPLSA